MNRAYQVIKRNDSRALADFLSGEGGGLLPIVELIERTEMAVDELIDAAGRSAIEAVLILSAQQVAGPKHPGKRLPGADPVADALPREEPSPLGNAAKGVIGWHGGQRGVVQLAERKVRITKPRLRRKGKGGGEVEVPAYAAMQNHSGVGDRLLGILMRGVSTRNYKEVLPNMAQTVGVSKSSISREFQEAGETALKELGERRFEEKHILVIDIDGMIFGGHHVLVAMSPSVMRLAPQGEKTLINKVDIANLPLREGLNRLLSPLGMSYVVLDDRVEVVPKPILRALGRAPTWAELDTLAWLAGLQPGRNPQDLATLEQRTQMQVSAPDAWSVFERAVQSVGAGPGDEVITLAANGLGWGWTLSGEAVIIGSLEQQTKRRLQQPIFVRFRDRTLFEIMQAIGDSVGVRIQIEPGALTTLPPQVQKNFSLDVRNKTAEQALDEIAAYTGLGYLIGPEGVMFFRPEGLTSAAPTAGTGGPNPDPYMAKLTIELGDGKTMDWLIRRSELPADLLEMRDRDIAEGFETVRRIRQASDTTIDGANIRHRDSPQP